MVMVVWLTYHILAMAARPSLTQPSIEIVYRDSATPTGPQDRFDRSGRSWRLNTPTSPWLSEFLESLESFSVFPSPSPCSRLGPRSTTQRRVRL